MKEFTIGSNDAGQRLDRFLAKAVPLPTDTWLGSMKKNTAAVMMIVPTVMMANSRRFLRLHIQIPPA